MRAAVVAVGLAAVALAGPVAAQPSGRVVGTVRITEADGQPAAADVVVYVVGFNEPPGDKVTSIAQKGRKFVPDLIAITVGEKVEFPNFDPFLHNVFSQSPPRKFDLGSFPKGESKEKDFPVLGVVDVYCNIHPEMAATILILPNRRHVVADPDGKFVLDGVPPGDWTVFAYTRRATKPISAKVTVKAGADAAVDLAIVRGAEPAHLNKYGEKYKDSGPTYH
ncbi:MAG TPA: carboxypeptidase regulatory-like domain-containing protein [Kofleriaceae bacterium]|jgi:plastocyanin|nr:carboxypeptidase regulatory-like domain-containing protein [Kofleriaceae bacterium]